MTTQMIRPMKIHKSKNDDLIEITPQNVSDFFMKISLSAALIMTIVWFKIDSVEDTVALTVGIICITISAVCTIIRMKIDNLVMQAKLNQAKRNARTI